MRVFSDESVSLAFSTVHRRLTEFDMRRDSFNMPGVYRGILLKIRFLCQSWKKSWCR